jgi:hypothetical protein
MGGLLVGKDNDDGGKPEAAAAEAPDVLCRSIVGVVLVVACWFDIDEELLLLLLLLLLLEESATSWAATATATADDEALLEVCATLGVPMSSVTRLSNAAKSSHKCDRLRNFEISLGRKGRLQEGQEL